MSNIQKDGNTLIDEIIPVEEVKKLEHGRIEEILQPLMDLGYINQADPSKLAMGIRLFRKDYLSLNLIPEFVPHFLSLPESELEGEELNLLHTLVALDGDFTLEIMPGIGTVNLSSRVIHYRLSIHHLYALPVDTPLSNISLQAIKKLSLWIKNLPANPIQMVNLLGDIPALIQHINVNANGVLNKRIVVFEYHKTPADTKFKISVSEDANKEVEEDEDDDEDDNEEEMLRLETDVDNQIDAIQEAPVFDDREQEILKKETKKNKKKRSRIVRIRTMIDLILEKLNKINTDIGAEGDIILANLKQLKKVKEDLSTRQNTLLKKIKEKDDIIDRLSTPKKQLRRKERQLKRKIRKKASQQEIEQLRQEIRNIKNANREIEKLQIEKSPLQIRLMKVEEDCKLVDRRIKSFEKQFDALLEERKAKFSEKQKELVILLDRLKALQARVDKIKFSFRGRLKKVLDKTFYEKEIKEPIFQNRNRDILKTFSLDAYNIYLTRLIQIFQWTNGYYYGSLDSQIGDRTFSALDDMSNYSKKLRLKFILSRLSKNQSGTKGYWILNIKYLFNKLSEIIKESPDVNTTDLLMKYETDFVKINNKNNTVGNEATDKAYDEIVAENQSDLKEVGIVRRIYYGIKSIASTLFKALSDLINLIRSGIKKLIYLVKNLVKIVYKEIREGVRKFKDGMQFLFGKRQFETPTANGSAILTKFDFDFDTLVFSPPGVSQQELLQHRTMLYRFSDNLGFTMELTGNILKWVFRLVDLGTPIGWARLAIRIAIRYKYLIVKWLISLGKKLTQTFIAIKYKVKEVPEMDLT